MHKNKKRSKKWREARRERGTKEEGWPPRRGRPYDCISCAGEILQDFSDGYIRLRTDAGAARIPGQGCASVVWAWPVIAPGLGNRSRVGRKDRREGVGLVWAEYIPIDDPTSGPTKTKGWESDDDGFWSGGGGSAGRDTDLGFHTLIDWLIDPGYVIKKTTDEDDAILFVRVRSANNSNHGFDTSENSNQHLNRIIPSTNSTIFPSGPAIRSISRPVHRPRRPGNTPKWYDPSTY